MDMLRSIDKQSGESVESVLMKNKKAKWKCCYICLLLHCHIVLLFFAGETGIGKSTLMDTLFNNNFDSTPSTHDLPNVKLKSRTYGMFICHEILLNEKAVPFTLSTVQ